VQSFIDTIGTHDDFVRGGPGADREDGHRRRGDPTSTAVDYSYGNGGLGGWSDILRTERQQRRQVK
jgi:levansucrase